jgi:AICAR transformylase/IMP cyclohydrolase PurH
MLKEMAQMNSRLQEYDCGQTSSSNLRRERELAEKYKKLIRKEFSLTSPLRAGLKYSAAERAIAVFRDLQPSPETLADVMLTLAEAACEYAYTCGDMGKPFYDGAYNNFVAALKFMDIHNLLDKFVLRVEQCVKWASPCGYGFADEIADVYDKFYRKINYS